MKVKIIMTVMFVFLDFTVNVSFAYIQKGKQENVSVLVLLGEWFGDAYFPLEKEISRRGWSMKRIGVDAEYRGCYNKARDVLMRSDILITDLKDFSGFDCLIIPSGPQWRKFNQDHRVLQFVRDAHAAGLLIASFCVGNTTIRAAGLVESSPDYSIYPVEVTLVKERILLGPRGGGPPPGDGFKSAPIKEICNEIARQLKNKKGTGTGRRLQGLYLDQKPPGKTPVIFAKEFMTSEHRIHGSPAFSPDLKEVYWSVFPKTDEFSTRTQVILFSKFEKENWTSPKLASFSGKYFDGGPFFSYDGKKLYFYSRRPLEENSNKETSGEIWYVERNGDGWSKPHHLAIDMKGDKLFFSLSKNKNLYFTSGHGPRGAGSGNVDIYVTMFMKNSYSKPEKLPDTINSRKYLESDVLISPDETYLIFYSFEKPGSFGPYDLYVSYKTGNHWSIPVNLGKNINKGYSRFPRFSPDGKCLFFVRQNGVYWVSTRIIKELKPKDLE